MHYAVKYSLKTSEIFIIITRQVKKTHEL